MDAASFINLNPSGVRELLRTTPGNGTINVSNNSKAESFDSIFSSAVNMITSTNDLLHDAAEAEVAYATGQMTNTHELAVIEQKANLSLQYTVAVKNQLLSAYKEIMNMQI